MSELEVRIEKIVAGGDGLARDRGRVVFVPGTAPGEKHRVVTVTEKRDYMRARSVERLEVSRERRAPPCPYYESCGGCSLMHLRPDAQLEAKKSILREGIERASKSVLDRPLEILGREELGYRNRLRLHVAFAGVKPLVGFRRRGSHEIVDIDRCLLGSPTLNECLTRLRNALSKRHFLARSLVSVELEESTSEPGRIAARFLVSTPHELRALGDAVRGELLTELGLEGLVAAVAGGGPLVRSGNPFVEHRVAGLTLRQSVGSFFQSNRFLLPDLVELVVSEGPLAPGVRALDLYSGVGLFALPLGLRGASVVGVESETLALEDARFNAGRAGLGNVRFLRGDAASYVLRSKLRATDLVVLDPPRGGLPGPLVAALGESPLRGLRYVSCDPAAFARDLARLEGRGFRLERLVLVDLFPNTHHFETVASFSRSG